MFFVAKTYLTLQKYSRSRAVQCFPCCSTVLGRRFNEGAGELRLNIFVMLDGIVNIIPFEGDAVTNETDLLSLCKCSLTDQIFLRMNK